MNIFFWECTWHIILHLTKNQFWLFVIKFDKNIFQPQFVLSYYIHRLIWIYLNISPYHYRYPTPCRYPPPCFFWDFEILKKLDRAWQWNSTFCCGSHRKWRKIFFISSSIIFFFTIRGAKNIIQQYEIAFNSNDFRFDNINYLWWFQLFFRQVY